MLNIEREREREKEKEKETNRGKILNLEDVKISVFSVIEVCFGSLKCSTDLLLGTCHVAAGRLQTLFIPAPMQ